MAFCSYCGTKLDVNAKFCKGCGRPVVVSTSSAAETIKQPSSEPQYAENNAVRKIVYDGEVHKCPNCGEVLDSLSLNCPVCGYEIRGVKNSESVHDFALRLQEADNDEKKATIIRSYPIPNTKEDIIEFMIIAATNFDIRQKSAVSESSKAVSSAWLIKIEQGYQKAKILFEGNDDFGKVQNIYNKICDKINQSNKNNQKIKILNTLQRTSIMLFGLLLFIIAFFIDILPNNLIDTSPFQLGGMVISIIGAIVIGKGNLTEIGIGAGCGMGSLILGELLENVFYENGSAAILSGIITLIIIAIIFIKTLSKKKET